MAARVTTEAGLDARREWVATVATLLSPVPDVFPAMHRVLAEGDRFQVAGPLDVVAAAGDYIAAHHPQLVPTDGVEGREWLRRQEEEAARRRAEQEWRDERARRWMEEHGGIPDYVVEFLRS